MKHFRPPLEIAPGKTPWEKLNRESGKAWEAFQAYRDLPPGERTIDRAAEVIGKGSGMLNEWSQRHHWRVRVQEYDAYLDQRMREARESEQEAMVRRHTQLSAALTNLTLRRLIGDPADAQVIAVHPNEIEAKDLPRFVEVAIRSERLAGGLPTDIVKAGLLIAPAEVTRIVNAIVGTALGYIAEERQEAFLSEVEQIGAA